MTHRARIAGRLTVLAVIGGFVFNAVSASSPPAGKKTPAEVEEDERPTAPLFVPRPAAMLIGRSLASDASAQEVASAFALAYFTYDPEENSPERFAVTLPKLDPDARSEIAGQIEEDAEKYRGDVDEGDTSSVTVVNRQKITSSPDAAQVRVILADRSGRSSSSGTKSSGQDGQGQWTMTVGLESGSNGQWLVTSATLK